MIRVRLNPQFICQYSSEVEQWPEKPHVGVPKAPVGTSCCLEFQAAFIWVGGPVATAADCKSAT